GAVDQRALFGRFETKEEGGGVSGVQHAAEIAQERGGVAELWRNEIKPGGACRHSITRAQGKYRSPLRKRGPSCFHLKPDPDSRFRGNERRGVTRLCARDRLSIGRARRGRSSWRGGRRRAARRRRFQPSPTTPFGAQLAARGRMRRSHARAAG